MRAVERGDRLALHDAISDRERTGSLSNAAAADVARAVAERELRAASGVDAVDRIRDVRPCAHELDAALAARTQIHDAAGAEAALARIDAGGLDAADARGFAGDPDPDWRALAARSLSRLEDHDARLRALVDPEPHVRRQAARAARDARDTADLSALAEAARVDPEPLVRTESVRAIGALLAEPNGGAIVDVLRDLWTSGDDGVREDIALVWSGASLWRVGGRDALWKAIGTGHGHAIVEAAAAVLRRRDADPEVTGASLAQLARAIDAGPLATRLQAIAQSPLDRAELLVVVRKAASDEDVNVRVGALARLAETRDPRVIGELESLAGPGSPVAGRARFALSVAGDRRVQSWIEQDLAADQPEVRLAAATELAAMGVAARGAPLLADANAAVRMRAACTMIMATRLR